MAHSVGFSPVGFAFITIDIRTFNKPTMATVRYKVDTGANCTTISHIQLSDLGYNQDWIKSGELLTGSACPTVATGNAISDCYRVILPEIRIGEWVGYN